MAEKRRKKFFKICLCGQLDVGKTSIFNALRGLPVTQNPKAEINYHDHIVNVAGEDVKLTIWDTAGMERYDSLTDNYYRSAKGIVAVFSVESSESFTYVQKNVQDVKECDFAPDAHFFLVGNKIDISTSDFQVQSERIDALLREEPRQFDSYFKTSAKLNKGIKELFDGIAHALVAAHSKPIIEEKNLLKKRYETTSFCSCKN